VITVATRVAITDGVMAVDIQAVCIAASDNQSTQLLAIVLSVMFSIYTIVAIALSALTIYSTSQAVPLMDAQPIGIGSSGGVSFGADVPLVSLRPTGRPGGLSDVHR